MEIRQYSNGVEVAEALQLLPAGQDPTIEQVDLLHSFIGHLVWHSDHDEGIVIHAPEDDYRAEPGGWIIKRADGEVTTCTDEYFKSNYKAVLQ